MVTYAVAVPLRAMFAALLPAMRCSDSSYAVKENGGINKCLGDFLA